MRFIDISVWVNFFWPSRITPAGRHGWSWGRLGGVGLSGRQRHSCTSAAGSWPALAWRHGDRRSTDEDGTPRFVINGVRTSRSRSRDVADASRCQVRATDKQRCTLRTFHLEIVKKSVNDIFEIFDEFFYRNISWMFQFSLFGDIKLFET